MPDCSLAAPVAGLGGAILVAATGYAVQRWRYRIDRLSAAADHIGSEANSAADLSAQYWLLDCADPKGAASAAALEPVLIGRQTRLQSLFLAFQSQDNKVVTKTVEDLLASLYDDLTGGNFKTANRTADPQKAQSAHLNAALLNGELRKAVSRRSYWWF